MSATLELKGITQKFGDVTALDSVDFAAKSGSIHALVGENGAGKTTLMRVLYGAIKPTSGLIKLNGVETRLTHSADAINHKIGMVSQHFSIIPELTCLQNLILGSEDSFFLKEREAVKKAEILAAKMEFKFNWSEFASELSPASAQKLEILKLLWQEAEIMILDEPTAMLSPSDSSRLFQSLKKLANSGATVIVVTHRLPEVMQYCDVVTVLRNGRKIIDTQIKDTSDQQLAELIVGHSVSKNVLEPSIPKEIVLEIIDLYVKNERDDHALKGINLNVREGEVVGIAGVDGNGQRELFRSLIGVTPFDRGTASFLGQELKHMSARQRIEAGLRLIPEDRQTEGSILEWNLIENSSLGLHRMQPISKGPWIDTSRKTQLAEKIAERFNTKHGGLNNPMSSLSGGNQQRIIAARAFALDPKLILAFQPTRGLDIDGTTNVFSHLRAIAKQGAAAIVVSFDLDELIENCDRILVLNGGKLYEPPSGEEHDRQTLGKLMVGAK